LLLTVIKPPNNAETAMADFKYNLYMNTDLLSAWALTPMVPIAVIPGDDIKLSRNNLPELPTEGLQLKAVETIAGQVCLGSAGLKEFCRKTAGALSSHEGSKPSLCGLHLCDSLESGNPEPDDVTAMIMSGLEQLDDSVLNWKSCSMQVYRTDSDIFSGFEWWKRVKLETILSIRYPKAQMHR